MEDQSKDRGQKPTELSQIIPTKTRADLIHTSMQIELSPDDIETIISEADTAARRLRRRR